MMMPFTATADTRSPSNARVSRWLAAIALVVSVDSLALGLGGGTDLYDAGMGKLPSEAPWSWAYGALGSTITTGMNGGTTFIDTTFSTGQAGYNLLSGATLDSTAGFTLDFALRIASETHADADRSGFSIIVLDNAARGVELSFWTNEVWTKNAGSAFSHGEAIPVDTSSVERSYSLTFLGNAYSLTSDGAPTLSGTLRNYLPGAVILGGLAPAVYGQSNYIFFGDNTGSASARVELSMINLAPVPEPGEWAMMLAGLACLATIARRRGALDRRP
jgi:hypothetical protein